MPKNKGPVTTIKKTNSLFSNAVLLSVISGVLLTASFPPLNLSFLSWVAFVPLFKCIEDQLPSRAFRLGLVTGAVHYLTLIYWIIIVLGRYGGLNVFLSFIPYLLLCLYLSLYVAVFSFLTASSRNSRFFLLSMGSFWVSLEYIRTNFLSGFPWCLLGYTQYRHLNLIQIADISGVYGLSFLVILANGLIYCLFFQNRKTKNSRADHIFLKWETLIVVLMAGGTLVYSHYRLTGHNGKKSSTDVKVAVVQGNIDQSVKWDPDYQEKTLETYQRLTRATYGFRPDLIVWPETSVPFFYQDGTELSSKVNALAKQAHCALLFGSPAYKQTTKGIHYYNRAYLVSVEQKQSPYYDKVHLVPFGEYIPFKKLLFFVNRLVPAAGDFSAGNRIVLLKSSKLSLGILICFEAIFPDIARKCAAKGANILVNLTNDAWFGKSSAPYQHLAMAVFRAVETRKPLIRAANTGFSAFIDPQGKIIMRSHLFCEETLKSCVHISTSPPTLYTRFGDLFALSLLLICLIKTFLLRQHRRNTGDFFSG